MHVITTEGRLKTTREITWPYFAGCKLGKSPDQILTTATWTIISWETEIVDTDSFHNTEHNSRITVPTTGYYLFTTHIAFGSNSTNTRYVAITVNSGGTPAGGIISYDCSLGNVSGSTIVSNGQLYHATAGDYFEVHCYQSSGGDLAVGTSSTEFSCMYLGG